MVTKDVGSLALERCEGGGVEYVGPAKTIFAFLWENKCQIARVAISVEDVRNGGAPCTVCFEENDVGSRLAVWMIIIGESVRLVLVEIRQ